MTDMLFVFQQKVDLNGDCSSYVKCGPRISKKSPAEEDDVEEDDVEITVEGGASGAGAPADEDPFEKQMRLSSESQVRAST